MLTVKWSSPYYDYMLVDGVKYLPVNSEGNSVFEIPVKSLAGEIKVIADTVAMSVPHEIEYTIVLKNEPKKLGSLDLKYAKCFSVDFYENDYVHIAVDDGSDYILVPEGMEDNTLGIEKPVFISENPDNIYLAASSAMDLFAQIDGLEKISYVSTKAEDYSIEEASTAINKGKMKYVGKYSAPDYETLVNGGCELAIESTMINHSPRIKEELTRLSIPVIVEKSSYEPEPMGRLEWIKLYGVLLGKQDEANSFFDAQVKKLEAMDKRNVSKTDAPSVAFFYISSNGYVNVRKSGDYISKMIDMAGGKYLFDDLKAPADSAMSTMNIGWEEFYVEAKDADILIYNSTVGGTLKDMRELLAKNELMANFKAVKNGRVYCTGINSFQKSSAIVDLIADLTAVMQDKSDGLKYTYKLN